MFRRQPEFHVAVHDDVVTLEGHRLEQLTDELRRLCGERAEVLSVERLIVGGLAGFFGREYFRIDARATGELRSVPAVTDGGASGRPDDPCTLDARSFAAALAAALEDGEPAPVPGDPVGVAGAEDPHGTAASAPAAPAASPMTAPAAPAPAPPVDLPPPAPTWWPQGPPTPPPFPPPAPAAPADHGVFVHLSLPELALPELLARLDPLVGDPVLPPEHGIVAIVGDPVHAVRTAQRLCELRGAAPEESVVLLARDPDRYLHPWPPITGVAEAVSRRRRWRNRPVPTFVAVGLDLSEEGIRWVRNTLIAVDPVQVRYAAPAWRHPQEHNSRVDAIARVDAVDLVDLDASPEPSAFLELAPAVATLDGRPVSAGLWAAHLLAAPTPLRALDHDLTGSCA